MSISDPLAVKIIDWETVIGLGGEGGRMSVKGLKLSEEKWLFTRITNEATLRDLLQSNEMDSLESFLRTQSRIVAGWHKGIELLNDGWYHLSPLEVHAEFAESVWEIAANSVDKAWRLRDWAKACFPDLEEAKLRFSEARKLQGYNE